MPSFTKKAIVESFLHLVGKKPIDKITVRDIVDDCGINRNTFYYYFQDIYVVLEDLCRALFHRIPDGQPLSQTLGSFYRQLADFTARFPHAAKSLALSLGFEGLERYLASDLDALICGCFARAECDPPPVTHLRLLRHGLLGLCLDTMRGDGNAALIASELEETLSALTPTDPDKT